MTISNTDFAIVNSYQLSIAKLPSVSFFSTKASLPGLSLTAIGQETPYRNVPQAGTNLALESFSIDFYVDKLYNNYIAAMQWIIALGRTDDSLYDQFLQSNLIQSTVGESFADSSDGSLIVYTTNNNPSLEVVYHDMIPTRLSTPVLVESTTNQVKYLQATMSFDYSYFDINQLNGL